MKRVKTIPFTALLLLSAVSCTVWKDTPAPVGETTIHLSVRAGTRGVNVDTAMWEDRVTELRMLVFDRSGRALRNLTLDFPHGFDEYCAPIPMAAGTFDIYFIANESAYSGDFTTALASITDLSQMDDAAFRNLEYDPDFVPDGTSVEGRFLMSAVYEDVVIGEGGTAADPVPLALPTGSVELVRAMAKVQLIFRKKVAGGSVPEGTVESVQLQGVTRDFSVPPIDVIPRAPLFVTTNSVAPADFDYSRDSIGSLVFYIPELLRPSESLQNTSIHINDRFYPLESDPGLVGLEAQRRAIDDLSPYSVIRNYDYKVYVNVNSAGGIELDTYVVPWNRAAYTYLFQDPDRTLVLPPVGQGSGGGTVIPTACGKIELLLTNETLSSGLQGAYNDQINYWDPVIQGPAIVKGSPPYFCEQKYGAGYRLINSCELMSFLALFDQAYRVWQSNTWQGIDSGLPFYPASFRQQAQNLLQQLTGQDLSMYHPSDTGVDPFGTMKLGILDDFFTPGDVMPTVNGNNPWPYPAPPETGIEPWFPMETVIQFKGYWYTDYLEYSDPANYDAILYQRFTRYNFSSTTSRCVRAVG